MKNHSNNWTKKEEAEADLEWAQKVLGDSVKEILNRTANKNSAKGVDVFGRNKEQVEMARLHRAGSKGIRVR